MKAGAGSVAGRVLGPVAVRPAALAAHLRAHSVAWSSRSACTAWPTVTFEKVAHLMEPLARFMLGVAVAAWALVAAAFVARLARHLEKPASGKPAAPSGYHDMTTDTPGTQNPSTWYDECELGITGTAG